MLNGDFIGIDFGTTNSLAGIVDDERKLQLVPLEGKSKEFPSAIFLELNTYRVYAINQDNLDRRVKNAVNEEERRFNQIQSSIKKNLDDFYRANVPRIKKPKPQNFISSIRYKKACERYLQDLNDLPSIIKVFNDTKMKDEELRLNKTFSPPKSIEKIKEQILVQMEQERLNDEEELISSQTFFTALDNPNCKKYFGQKAIDMYKKNPLGGFFMRSPKAFIGIDLHDSHKDLFVRIIALVLTEIKFRSEKFLGRQFAGVVLGYPVNYMGANSIKGNQQALNIMRKAAQLSGFSDIRFVIEPMAAALANSKTIFDSSAPALVVDIGGGTSDVVLFDLNAKTDEKLSVIHSVGERIGGNDFDEILAKKKFGPFIGGIGEFKNGNNSPNQILFDALSTRDLIAQAKFRKCGQELYKLISQVNDPIPFKRLYQIYFQQLQHEILLISEDSKMKLSASNSFVIKFDLFDNPFSVELHKSELSNIYANQLNALKKIIFSVFEGYESYKNNYRIFLTGGMSRSPILIDFIKQFIPAGTVINRMDSLQSVVAGLAIVARQLDLSDDSYKQDFLVRGIPVKR